MRPVIAPEPLRRIKRRKGAPDILPRMSRPTRFAAALLALVALLFAQLAVSAYACPGMAAADEAPMAGMEGCGEVPTPNLCDGHCDYGTASVGPSSLDAQPAAIDLRPLRVVAQDVPTRPQSAHPGAPPGGHSPPPLVLFGVLRI